jgi:hypothetical protein
MVDNPLWEICERVAEVQALLDDHMAGGGRGFESASCPVPGYLRRPASFLVG